MSNSANTPPAGARWIRSALQVNPFAYVGSNAPSSRYNDEASYNAALLDKCVELKIELIAVTDHWRVDSACGLLADGPARGVHVLPGFEANTSEGIHMLVLFEEGTPVSTVNAAIGRCGGTPGCDNGITGLPFDKLLAEMAECGALAIPAHTNVPNSGMLTNRKGAPLVNMVTHDLLHAIGITPGRDAGNDQEHIIAGRKPYDRPHPLAVIHADDINAPETLETCGATSWFKAGSPSLQGLKTAVRTPETRVSVEDPTAAPRAVLRSVTWTGGFLDGVTLPLSSDLTSLIGGRGTGKSTVIESVRHVLGIPPIGASARRDHEAIIKQVLGPGAMVSLRVDTVAPSLQSYLVKRTAGQAPTVSGPAEEATQLKPSDILPQVEVYGQHELAELSQDKSGVARMLQRLAGIPDDDPEGDSIRANLARNREDLGRAERDLEELKARLEDIPRLEDSQRRFSETDLPARLKESRVLQSEEARFETAATHVATETARLQPALVTGTGDTPDEVSKTEADSSARGKALGGLDAAMRTLNMRLGEAAGIIQGALDGARHEVEILRAAWRQATQPLRDGTAEVLRTLAEEGHDPNQYLQAAKKLDDLTDEAKKQGLREGTVKSLSSDRASLLRQLADHSNHRLETLHEAIRTANNATQGVVVVKPATSPQRTHVFSLIESCVAGQRTKIKAAVEAPDFSPQEFAQTCRLGVGELEDKYQINGTQAQRLVEAGETLFRQIEEQVIDYAVDVELDIGSGSGTRQYRKLDDLSKGQKATALLLLLLGAAQGTLIIDQPEDDLDNRFIYEGVVKRLRQLKGVRQVIVATHNANVPVLGDAELLVVLDGDGEHGYPVQDGVGSLDDPSIRRLVEDVLEGGQAAFTARQHLYGF